MNSTDIQSEAGQEETGQENFVIMGKLSGQEYENLAEMVKGFKKMKMAASDCYCTGGGAKVGSGGGDCRCPNGGAGSKLI